MPLLLGNYDPALMNVVVGGVIIDGYADGTFIKASRNQDLWSYQPSNSGGGSRSRNPDRSGRIEFTLHAGSPSNAYLGTLCRTDELLGTGVVETQVKDRSTAAAAVDAAQSWIVKMADFERQKEVGEINWVIETNELIVTPPWLA
jgi:hypothetical protein